MPAPAPPSAKTSITVYIPPPLRSACGGARELSFPSDFAVPATVRAVLAELERRFPALYRGICDDTGAVRRHLNVFVNSSHVRDRGGLEVAVASGDTIIIMTAVSGG